LNGFNDSFAFSTWAYQITRNCAIDALRKKRVQPQTAVLEEEEWERLLIATDESVRDHLHLEEVKRAILALPLHYREAFSLFYLEEKTYEEMIDILKKPKGTIASLINRAKTMVRQNLERGSAAPTL
jgi:RNA polymerase sigma-70 factor (ECF subfamily)